MSKNTVKRSLTRNRRRDVVENDEYHAFATRILRAYSRRVRAGDVEALGLLVGFAADVETPSATPSSAYATTATPGRKSPPASASLNKPRNSGGAVTGHDRHRSRSSDRRPSDVRVLVRPLV
jgi:hypothetical protein